MNYLEAREHELGLLDEPSTSPPEPDHIVDANKMVDRWGNEIVSGPGDQGQTVVRGAWDGRLVSVCGQAANSNHVQFWDYSAHERRFKCVWCFARREGQVW